MAGAEGDGRESATVELSELSRQTALLMPSLSRIVRELELRGYMHKAADQRDLRRILATLTDRGRLLVEIASPECDAVHVAIHKAMGTDKMLKLARPPDGARKARSCRST